MKYCEACGATLNDNDLTCPICGSAQTMSVNNNQVNMAANSQYMSNPNNWFDPSGATAMNAGINGMGNMNGMNNMNNMNGMNNMNNMNGMNNVMPNMNGMNNGMMPQQNSMQPGMMPNMNSMNNGMMPQQNSMQSGMMPNMNGVSPSYGMDDRQVASKGRKNKKSSKGIIIALIALILVAGLGIGAYFLFFGKKHKAKKAVENYIETIERKDIKGLIQQTVPRGLVDNALSTYAPMINQATGGMMPNLNYDALMSYLDIAIASSGIQKEIDAISIKINDLEIGDVSKFDLKSYADNYIRMIASSLGGGLGMTTDEMIEDLEDELGMRLDNAYAMITSSLSSLGLDINDFLVVEISFNAEIVYEGQTLNFKSSDYGINDLIVYKYDGEYYVLPFSAIYSAAVLPAQIKYTAKSQLSSDISTANTIATAIQTALANETVYDEFMYNNIDQKIPFTKDGLDQLTDFSKNEITSNLKDPYPVPRNTANGANRFSFMVDSTGRVYVYIESNDECWEVYPDIDSEYR